MELAGWWHKLDSNKIEAQKLELTKSTVSQESRGQFHKLSKIIFILRMSQVTIDYHNYFPEKVLQVHLNCI